MNAESDRQPQKDGRNARSGRGWYATFSFLDVGGAVSASQLHALVAAIARIWRLTVGKLADRARPRVVGW
jgi:hypothetical protein